MSAASPAVEVPARGAGVRHVCIVGAGFSGCMVAAQMLHMASSVHGRLHVHLIERRPSVGEGAAYSTRQSVHLLNVPVRGMSAWTNRPEDFLEWMRRERPETKPCEFVERRLYARYLRETLDEAVRRSQGAATLETVHGEATHVERRPDRSWLVHRAGGPPIPAEIVVIATGHRAPGDPFAGRWEGPRERLIADPWRPDALAGIGAGDAVAIIGTGLTAMDAVLTLNQGSAGERPPIHLLSRSGLLPAVHARRASQPVDMLPVLNDLAFSGKVSSVRALLRAVRTSMHGRGARRPMHDDWRAVIDGLRPYTQGIWGALPLAERRRFFRHLRSWWDMHRHRMAPEIGERIHALIGAGRLVPVRARLLGARADAEGVAIRVREASAAAPAERVIRAHWVINCSGPSPSVGHAEDRATASLIDAGEARMDPFGLGLETDLMGRPIDGLGRSSGGLWVVGSLRRPALWETTAVPELRAQAEATAQACVTALA